jgi:putative membrane protein insertion efficiency factor
MIARLLIAVIRIYQRTLSPLLGNVCRFEPSCSRYAAACLAEHGALKGSLLSMARLCKCHPFHPGGFDPPPLKEPRRDARLASKGPASRSHARSDEGVASLAHD